MIMAIQKGTALLLVTDCHRCPCLSAV